MKNIFNFTKALICLTFLFQILLNISVYTTENNKEFKLKTKDEIASEIKEKEKKEFVNACLGSTDFQIIRQTNESCTNTFESRYSDGVYKKELEKKIEEQTKKILEEQKVYEDIKSVLEGVEDEKVKHTLYPTIKNHLYKIKNYCGDRMDIKKEVFYLINFRTAIDINGIIRNDYVNHIIDLCAKEEFNKWEDNKASNEDLKKVTDLVTLFQDGIIKDYNDKLYFQAFQTVKGGLYLVFDIVESVGAESFVNVPDFVKVNFLNDFKKDTNYENKNVINGLDPFSVLLNSYYFMILAMSVIVFILYTMYELLKREVLGKELDLAKFFIDFGTQSGLKFACVAFLIPIFALAMLSYTHNSLINFFGYNTIGTTSLTANHKVMLKKLNRTTLIDTNPNTIQKSQDLLGSSVVGNFISLMFLVGAVIYIVLFLSGIISFVYSSIATIIRIILTTMYLFVISLIPKSDIQKTFGVLINLYKVQFILSLSFIIAIIFTNQLINIRMGGAVYIGYILSGLFYLFISGFIRQALKDTVLSEIRENKVFGIIPRLDKQIISDYQNSGGNIITQKYKDIKNNFTKNKGEVTEMIENVNKFKNNSTKAINNFKKEINVTSEIVKDVSIPTIKAITNNPIVKEATTTAKAVGNVAKQEVKTTKNIISNAVKSIFKK